MYYNALLKNDTANGEGVRVTLFVSGCRHKCKGCFNEQTWDFKYGQEFTDVTLNEILRLLQDPFITGLSILGGEPLDPRNVEGVERIVRTVRDVLPSKNIWVWTGSTLAQLRERQAKNNVDAANLNSILSRIDILVDGLFEEDKADPTLKWRGSSNQNIIEVKNL